MDTEFIAIIQCEIAHRRCSGFACTQSFYEKKGTFKDAPDTKYISFTCGGCCGKGVSSKLMHFGQKLQKMGISKDQVTVHLASCMTSDNFHYDRCPHIGVLKKIIDKRGFKNLVEGTYISQKAEAKRKAKIYKSYE